MDALSPSSQGPRVFQIQNGLVISESGQQDADDFAADFQGLRHFADRIGGSLELGASLYAALHEPGFTFMFLLPPDAQSLPGSASGAMIGANVSNNELLVTLRQRQA
jgi:hypothetical protein